MATTPKNGGTATRVQPNVNGERSTYFRDSVTMELAGAISA